MIRRKDNVLNAEVKMEDGTAVVTVQGSGGILEARKIRELLNDLADKGTARVLFELGDLDTAASLAVTDVLVNFVRESRPGLRIELTAFRPEAELGQVGQRKVIENPWTTIPIFEDDEDGLRRIAVGKWKRRIP